MRIASVGLENVRGVPDGVYSFSHAGRAQPVVVVTGPPRSGKTALLEAIAFAKERFGAYGPPPRDAGLLRKGKDRGRVAVTLELAPAEAEAVDAPEITLEAVLGGDPPERPEAWRTLLSAYETGRDVAKWEYFPDDRALFPKIRPGSEADEKASRMRRSPLKYASLVPWLAQRYAAGGARAAEALERGGALLRSDHPDPFAELRRALAALVPDVRLQGALADDEGPALRFALRGGGACRAEELSRSEQMALLLLGTWERAGLDRSIVLLDTPELGFAPEDHVRVLGTLASLSRDGQLVVATSSPAITAAARPEQRVVLT